MPLAAVVRHILSEGLDTEIAEQSLGTINSIVRKVIRAELKATENRLAKRQRPSLKPQLASTC